MILAQIIIVMPIIISLSYASLLNKYINLNEYLVSINTSNAKKIYTIIRECIRIIDNYCNWSRQSFI